MGRSPRVLLTSAGPRLAANLGVAFLLLVVACGSGNRSKLPAVPASSAIDDTAVGPGDVFEVRVLGESDFTAKFRVSNTGTIDYPLVGQIEVAGLDPENIGDLIEDRLQQGEILVDPQVSVFVEEYNSKRVTVVGEVARPGTFSLTPGLTLVQVISLAGGYTAMANRDGTMVTRRIDGELRRFRVAVDRITRGSEEDVSLRPGDIVFVPQRLL